MDPTKLLKEYQDKGYNILTPSITLEGLSPYHHATVETVLLSSDTAVGDVYPHKADNQDKPEGRQYRIAKQGLDKLAVLAGVIWHQEGGSRRIDDRKDPNYVAFEAFGAIRKADGQLVPVKAFYDLDFVAIEDDLRHQYRAKGGKGQYAKKGQELEDYVEYCVGRDMRSKRKHRATLCESGARNRVIRALLGIKKVYTYKELQKPFVCLRITYQPDYNDPEVKKLITLASIGAQMNVYGMQAGPALPPPDAKEDYEDVTPAEAGETEGEVVDTEPNGIEDEDPPGPEPDPADDFENWDRKSRESHVKALAERKNYNLAALLKRMKISKLSALSDVRLLAIFDKLNSLPDDDIPF